MWTVENAVARILSDVRAPVPVECPLAGALGAVLAADVVAAVDVPPWDNSAMDGYAVLAADCQQPGVVLPLVGHVAAGHPAKQPLLAGGLMAIMTGAPVPEGADAVVMIERTELLGPKQVRVDRVVSVGDHIRRRGEDIQAGQVVLRAGEVLTPARLGLLAAVGRATVLVAKRPRVALVSTGDELVEPGEPLRAGAIYASNAVVLAGLVREAGGEPVVIGVARDDLAHTTALLREALSADVVLTTGGVSVGAHDVVKAAFEALGAELTLWRVAMKPGKPLAYGLWQGEGRAVPLFGLPGNPASCIVGFHQFVRPWLRAAQGDGRPYWPVVEAVLGEDVQDAPGRARFLRVSLSREGGQLVAVKAGSQSSGVLSAVAAAHGLLLLGPEVGGLPAGSAVRVQLLDVSFLAGATPDYGW